MRNMAEMPYHLGLKVKIYPSNRQKHLIAVNDGAGRAVYNHLVACGNERYRMKKAEGSVPVYRERLEYLSSVCGAVKNIKNALPFLYGKEVDEQVIANAVLNYRKAWKNRKKLHTGVPVFKRKSYEQSYQTNAHYYTDKNGTVTGNVRFEDLHHVTLPKLGRIRMSGSPKLLARLITGDTAVRIGTVTISRDSVGEYWASFSMASESPFYGPLPKTGSRQGIDLNLTDLASCSDRKSIPNRHFYTSAQKKLAKKQRRLSRMAERARKEGRPLVGAVNYQKQRKAVAALHRKTARQREQYLHVFSKREVENQDFIAAEELKVRNMKRNHHLAKHISDAGWRRFLTMLQYKAALYGKTVLLVPPSLTTQTCSVCGYVMKGKEHLGLDVREWECPACHTRHDRDKNAAVNILNRGLRLAEERGLVL